MNILIERIRDKIEDADEDVIRSQRKCTGEDSNYSAGYDVGYAEALRELYAEITGDPLSPQNFIETECHDTP